MRVSPSSRHEATLPAVPAPVAGDARRPPVAWLSQQIWQLRQEAEALSDQISTLQRDLDQVTRAG